MTANICSYNSKMKIKILLNKVKDKKEVKKKCFSPPQRGVCKSATGKNYCCIKDVSISPVLCILYAEF